MNSKPLYLKSKLFWSPIFIALVTSVIYVQVLHYGFVNFDDDGYVYNNSYVKTGYSIEGLKYAFTTMDKGNYIPLTWLSYMLDTEIFGVSPAGYHFTNLLFHVLNTLLLFFFLRVNTRRRYLSFLVAMLFAVHPLHVESVAWISERKDVLSAFWGLLALIFYCKFARRRTILNYALTLLLFLGSLLSKPMLVTLPVVFCLVDFWPLQRVSSRLDFFSYRKYRFLIIEKIPFFIFSVAFSMIAVFSQKTGDAMASFTGYPFLNRLMNALVSYGTYVYKTIWPFQLSVYYPYPHQLNVAHLLISGLVLITISCFVILSDRKHPYLLVGWFWFLVTLLPVIGLIQVGTQAMADRYMYIPSIGLFIGVVWGGDYLRRQFRISRKIAIIAAVLVVLSFLAITMRQLKTWQNSATLYRHALSVTQNNWLAHFNFGEALFEKGLIDNAITQYHQSIEIKPNFELAYLNLGVALARKGQIDEAIDNYKIALKIRSNLPGAWYNIGIAYFRKKMFEQALLNFYKALKVKPDYPDAYCGIGAVLAGQGKLQVAKKEFEKALEIDPYSMTATNALRKIENHIQKTKEKSKTGTGEFTPVP